MNARRSPDKIGRQNPPDQGSNLGTGRGAAGALLPGDPGPEEPEAFRCQDTTISGLTMIKARRQSFRVLERQHPEQAIPLTQPGVAVSVA